MSRIAKVGAVALGTGAMVLSGAGLAVADASAKEATVGSGGLVSGNKVQVPIHMPIQLCGTPVTVFGALNSTVGNVCKNGDDKKDDKTTEKKTAKKAGHRHGH
jgi:hypothetical protein